MEIIKEKEVEYETKDAIKAADEYGIDVSLLYENLKRSPTERLEQNEQMLEFAQELKRAGKQKHG